MKHTPGPWVVSSTFGKDLEIVTYSEGHRFFIATVEYADRASVEVANANLIAAAPEMHDAIQDALQLIEWWDSHACDMLYNSKFCTVCHVKRRLEYAIAQARGENRC